MSTKIMLLETADVFDIDNINADPITQLDAGTEIEIDSVMKNLKYWRKITLPDGKFGLMSVQTKAKVIEYDPLAPVICGRWSNFEKILMSSSNPDQYGFDMPICLKEFEQEVKKLIQTSKKPEMVILACYHAAANGFLKEDVVTENVVDTLNKNALKVDLSAINSLIQIEQIQKRQIISDEIIRRLVEQAKKATPLIEIYTDLLVKIAFSHQNQQIVLDILDIYRTATNEDKTYRSLRGLRSINNDNKIIDLLITQLDQGFRVSDKSVSAQSLSDLFLNPQKWGPAFYAAEELLAIGAERGIREIVPHLLKFIGEYVHRVNMVDYYFNMEEIADWHVRNRDSLSTDLNGLIPNLNEDSSFENKKIHDYIELFLEKLEAVDGNNG